MKKILLPILIAFVSVLPMRAQNVLVIDVSSVFNSLFELKNEMNKLKGTTDSYSAYLQQQTAVLQSMLAKASELETQAKNPALAAESRQAFESQWANELQLIDKQKLDIQQFYQTSNDIIQKGQQQIVQLQLDKMKNVVKEIAVQKKANLVLNSSPLGMISSVIYSNTDTAMDITDAVLKKLNDDYLANGGTAPPTGTSPTPTPSAATGTSLTLPMPSTGTAKPPAATK